MVKLATYLRRTRIAAGISQAEIASSLGFTSSQLVSNWERGKCKIPLKHVLSFCKLTKSNPKDLQEIILAESRTKLNSAYEKVMQKMS
jgi:transcriptional regulator with XRE-family HTH domain